MTTARDLINRAYRKISVLGQGSSLTAEEANDALVEMNAMIAVFSTEGALIFTETKETFNLSGATSYTIGASQTFDTTLPKDIKAAFVTYSGLDYALNVISQEDYAAIADKDITGVPRRIYYDSNYPVANIYLHPVGDGSETITMFTEKPLTGFSTLDTAFAMPPEYETFLVYNLAVRMAPEYEIEAPPTVKRIASDSLKRIKAQNKKNNLNKIAVDSVYLNGGTYDIKTGGYV